jgi:hypothetical protein
MATSAGYYHSIEVFDQGLAVECYEYLGKAMKVTFARSDKPYTKTEGLLAEKLVDRCRDALDRKDITENRTVLFGPFRHQQRLPGNPERQARALATKGFSGLVIADTLGYSYQTLRRWGIDAGRQQFEPNGTKAELELLTQAGHARVLEVRPDDERSPKSKHYLFVGAALAWLRQVV